MNQSGRCVIGFVLIAWALLFGLAFFFFVEGTLSPSEMLTAVWMALDGLPKMLWWILSGAVLVIWALRALAQLARQGLAAGKTSKVEQAHGGRLREVQRLFDRAESSLYCLEETQGLLRSLAIDLIALRWDVSDETARQRLIHGEQDEDSLLRALFVEASDRRSERPPDLPKRNQANLSIILDDIEKKLTVLNAYGDFTQAEGKS